jgi:hypothetical protein
MHTLSSEEQETKPVVQASRRVDFLLAPKWERVAPCQWRAVQHRGINESSLNLSVRLEEHAYRWDVMDGGRSVASGVCKTPGHARACAMRVSTDWAATLRPAPARTIVAGQTTTTRVEVTSLDREIFPYLIGLLLVWNLAYEVQASLVSGGGSQSVTGPIVMALSAFICLAVYRNWNKSL